MTYLATQKDSGGRVFAVDVEGDGIQEAIANALEMLPIGSVDDFRVEIRHGLRAPHFPKLQAFPDETTFFLYCDREFDAERMRAEKMQLREERKN